MYINISYNQVRLDFIPRTITITPSPMDVMENSTPLELVVPVSRKCIIYNNPPPLRDKMKPLRLGQQHINSTPLELMLPCNMQRKKSILSSHHPPWT